MERNVIRGARDEQHVPEFLAEEYYLFTEARAAEVKPRWGAGPWQDEPDRVQWWTPQGMLCLALRGQFGSWCGYIALRPDHPWYKQPNPGGDPHGGFTYAGLGSETIGWDPPGADKRQEWWILGWDYNHAYDVSPVLDALLTAIRANHGWHRDDHYWTLAEVRADINAVAAVAAAAMRPPDAE